MSLELEVLDQLIGGDLPLPVVCELFDDESRFVRAIEAMLDTKEIRLLIDGSEVPRWRWHEILGGSAASEAARARLTLTQVGARRIA